MPRKTTDILSPAEWRIMKIVWELKACAIGDIAAVAQKDPPGWSRSTVKSLLRRVVRKGYVKTQKVGNSFLYRPAKSPLKSMLHAIDKILENAFEGASGPIVTHVIQKCDLSPEEARELQALLEEYASPKEKDRKK